MSNVIGDIAGNYKTLMALIKKMPDEEVIGLGDLNDRGPRSKEVFDWFMANGRSCLGNHEHLMLSYYNASHFYMNGVWVKNGGGPTMKSFEGVDLEPYLAWIEALPLYIEVDGCLISHAFWSEDVSLETACDLGQSWVDVDQNLIWNRDVPIRRPGYRLQVAGHNSHFGLRRFTDAEGEFAVCIDTSRSKVLTGINLPSGKVYQQEYID